MRWIKWYSIDWINSTARDELTPAERSTFTDFVCLASFPGSDPGTFKFSSWEALARKLNTPLEVIESTRDKCTANRISVSSNSEGLLVTILNWNKYQGVKSDNSFWQEHQKSDNNISPKNRVDKTRQDKTRNVGINRGVGRSKRRLTLKKSSIQSTKKTVFKDTENLKNDPWYQELKDTYPLFKDVELLGIKAFIEKNPHRVISKTFLINWAKNIKETEKGFVRGYIDKAD